MPDYTVTSRIQGDRLYAPGEVITLTPKEAKELTPLGCIDPKPLKVAPSANKGSTPPPKKEDETGETTTNPATTTTTA